MLPQQEEELDFEFNDHLGIELSKDELEQARRLEQMYFENTKTSQISS